MEMTGLSLRPLNLELLLLANSLGNVFNVSKIGSKALEFGSPNS